jgi:hypothetical protein
MIRRFEASARRPADPFAMLAEHGHHPIGGSRSGLVLPDPDDTPAGRLECGVVPPVACDVPIQLRSPVSHVRAWVGPVLRTLMPKAAIYEDGDFRPREDDVWTTAQAWHGLNVFAETKASTMQLRAQLDLGSCLARAVALHDPPNAGR